MVKSKTTPKEYVQPYRYPSPNIPMSAIKRFARQIAEKFKPDKIILFGSYAYGTPNNNSDVDLLVIMPARNAIDQALKIDLAFDPPFATDLIVRTPHQLKIGLKEDDRNWFLYEITEKGKVLYEAPNREVDSQSGRGHQRSTRTQTAKATPAKSRSLPLSTSGRKVPQGANARIRRSRAKNS